MKAIKDSKDRPMMKYMKTSTYIENIKTLQTNTNNDV